jgi:hypothetical protein
MKLLLGDFSVKVDGENICKPTVVNDSLHEISKGDKVRVVNFTTSENPEVQSTMFPHHNTHKFT